MTNQRPICDGPQAKDQEWGDLEGDPMNHTVYGVALHQQTIHGGERPGEKGGGDDNGQG